MTRCPAPAWAPAQRDERGRTSAPAPVPRPPPAPWRAAGTGRGAGRRAGPAARPRPPARAPARQREPDRAEVWGRGRAAPPTRPRPAAVRGAAAARDGKRPDAADATGRARPGGTRRAGRTRRASRRPRPADRPDAGAAAGDAEEARARRTGRAGRGRERAGEARARGGRRRAAAGGRAPRGARADAKLSRLATQRRTSYRIRLHPSRRHSNQSVERQRLFQPLRRQRRANATCPTTPRTRVAGNRPFFEGTYFFGTNIFRSLRYICEPGAAGGPPHPIPVASELSLLNPS